MLLLVPHWMENVGNRLAHTTIFMRRDLSSHINDCCHAYRQYHIPYHIDRYPWPTSKSKWVGETVYISGNLPRAAILGTFSTMHHILGEW